MNELKFHVFRGANRDWYFHLRAGNGEIIAQGEGYRRKRDLLHAIGLIKQAASALVVFEKEIKS